VSFVDVTSRQPHLPVHDKVRLANPNFKKRPTRSLPPTWPAKEFGTPPVGTSQFCRREIHLHVARGSWRPHKTSTKKTCAGRHRRYRQGPVASSDPPLPRGNQRHRRTPGRSATGPIASACWLDCPAANTSAKELEVEMPACEFDRRTSRLIRDKAKRGDARVGGWSPRFFTPQGPPARRQWGRFPRRRGARRHAVDNRASTRERRATAV